MSTIPGKSVYASGFDPRTIPGCQMWFDAADKRTVLLSGSNITQWNDKSGNGYNVAQATSSNRPVYSVVNNLNMIQFVRANATYLLSTSIPQSFINYTLFLLMKRNPRTDNERIFVAVANGLPTDWDNTNGFSMTSTVEVASAGNGTVTVDNDTNTLFYKFVINNNTLNMFKNGATTVFLTRGMGLTGSSVGILLGANAGNGSVNTSTELYDGYIGEIIGYTNVLTSAQQQQVEGYLASKWALTSTLPAIHPFKSVYPFTRPFEPSDLPGCVLWMDAADATTVTLSGNNITQLKDKSSNAYTFATASGFTYNVVKFNTSYPSFYCPTSTAGFSLGSNASFALNQPFCAFAVGGNLISPSSGGYFWDSTSNANRAALVAYGPGGQPVMFAGVELKSTNLTSFTNALILGCFYNSTSSILFENGSNTSATNNVGTQNMSSLRLGAAWPLSVNWNGHICEILFFNRFVTNTEQRQIEGYLANKWGLRGNLASTHPYKLYPPLTPVFTPVQISNCALWLDAGDQTSMTLSGSNVTQWRDKSGNTRHLGVGSGNTTYISNSVRLNASYMVVSNAVNLQNFTYFIVSASPIGIANQSVFAVRPAGGAPEFSSLDGFAYYLENPSPSKTIIFYFIATPVSYIVDTTLPSLSNPFIAAANGTSAGSYTAWVNGTSSGTASTAARTTTAAGFHIGAQWNGTTFTNIISYAHIYEIIVFNISLTTAQRQTVEGYLAHKWGLLNSLPASHPYKKIRT